MLAGQSHQTLPCERHEKRPGGRLKNDGPGLLGAQAVTVGEKDNVVVLCVEDQDAYTAVGIRLSLVASPGVSGSPGLVGSWVRRSTADNLEAVAAGIRGDGRYQARHPGHLVEGAPKTDLIRTRQVRGEHVR